MPKFYCDYCDIYLAHSSIGGRRQHCIGRKHIQNKIDYYQKLVREQGISTLPGTAGGIAPPFLGAPPAFPGMPPIFPGPPGVAGGFPGSTGLLPHFPGGLPPTMPGAPHVFPGVPPPFPTPIPGGFPLPPVFPGQVGFPVGFPPPPPPTTRTTFNKQ